MEFIEGLAEAITVVDGVGGVTGGALVGGAAIVDDSAASALTLAFDDAAVEPGSPADVEDFDWAPPHAASIRSEKADSVLRYPRVVSHGDDTARPPSSPEPRVEAVVEIIIAPSNSRGRS